MKNFTISRVAGGAALALGALLVGSATHLPAVAAAEYQQWAGPQVAATCASSGPCMQETNSKAGAGIQGTSSKGNGTVGQTKLKSTSLSSAAGVLGQDLSTQGTTDSGVLGTSTNGIGVQGRSTSGAGVRASSVGTSALFSESTFGDGAQIVGDNNDGTNSTTANNSSNSGIGRSGVWGHDDTTDGGRLNYGVAGSSVNGTGMIAVSTNWVGDSVFGGGVTGSFPDYTFYPALSVSSNTYFGVPLDIFDGCSGTGPCDNGNYVVRINGVGDEYLTGDLFTAGPCSSGCAKTRQAGKRVISYASHEAQPTMEDVGEAQLVAGRADIPLEAKFAGVIDQRARYYVFVTPEGDCDQLYVTGKSASGFSVRESHGGRSNVAFQYRIVARPYGNSSARLPDVHMNGGRSLPPVLR